MPRSAGWRRCASGVALPVATRKRLAAAEGFAAGPLALLRATDEPAARAVDADIHALASDGIGLAPPPLLDGRALIAAGLRPGPAFKKLLDDAYDAQLDGRVRDAEAALAFARSVAERSRR